MADSGGTEELDIRWEDLDKSKFFFYGSTMFFGVRATLYPASLIKTRMQAASGEVYKSTWDAVKTIVRSEGPTGLYKGFWVSSFNLVFRQVYFTTFEVLREVVGPGSAAYGLLGPRYGELARNLAAGAGAQVVFQSFTVPLDVVTQRMMLAGAGGAAAGPAGGAAAAGAAAAGGGAAAAAATAAAGGGGGGGLPRRPSALRLARGIWAAHGWRGFFRGYTASLVQFTPNSAIFWAGYGTFLGPATKLVAILWPKNQEDKQSKTKLENISGKAGHGKLASRSSQQQLAQAMASVCGGVASTIITNPIDVVRTRLQVTDRGHQSSIGKELVILWNEGGIRSMFKGLGPRMIATAPASVLVISVYDLIKRLSLRDDVALVCCKTEEEEFLSQS